MRTRAGGFPPAIILLFAAGLALAGCAAPSGVGTLRFANQPAARLVDDRRDVAQPAPRVFARSLYMLDAFFARRVPRALELEPAAYAGDVNALDEVPDSTWFTNRIGARDLTPDELRAAGRDGAPAPRGPWTITGTKVGGASPGFLVKDATGAKFIMKFDTPGAPDMQTGADVVVQKLLWAAGFNTPEDAIVVVRRADLALAAKARVEDTFGTKRPMTLRDLEDVLAKIDHEPDGSYRALVSRYLAGAPLGGYAQEGERADDPNDRVRHEDRRSLRGQRVFFAWLGNTDVKEDNGLDMWVADGDLHYVMHYLVDFGLALGVYGWDQSDPSDGYAKTLDLRFASLSLVTLGGYPRPWEGAEGAALRGVGRFESRHFDPLGWSARYPYAPFDRVDPADGFWAAKIIMRFTEPELRAAVESGRYADPRAVDYLVRTLVERQRVTGYTWFSRVSPLDRFELSGDQLCFTDLMLASFAEPGTRGYVAHSYDYRGHLLGTAHAAGAAHACLAVPLAASYHGYTIVELAAIHDGRALPAIRVHLARDAGGAVRVIDVRRSQP